MKNEVIIANSFLKKVKPYLENARKSIDILVFDWRFYPNEPAKDCQQFNQLVFNSAKRGVRVRAIVNSDDACGNLRRGGVAVQRHRSFHLLHAKLMIIDDEVVITGSHNYTQNALSANYELSVILKDIDNIKDYKLFFDSIWRN